MNPGVQGGVSCLVGGKEMMRFFTAGVVFLLIVVPSAMAPAQESGSHRVVVRLQRQNEIHIEEPENQDDASAASANTEVKPSSRVLHTLGWTVQASLKKITVSADAISGNGLCVRAVHGSGCIPSGRIALTPSGRDLVTMTDASMGGCGLEYTLDEGWRMSRKTGECRIFYTITDAF